MKILFITSRADVGGGPQHIRLLMESLRQDGSGIDIYLACPDDKPFHLIFLKILGADKIITIPHRKLSIRSLLDLRNFIKREGIEVVHSHGKGAGTYSRILRILNPRLKVIHTFHGFHIGGYGKTATFLYKLYESIAALLTNAMICVSQTEFGQIKGSLILGKNKLSLIPNGVLIPPKPTERKFNEKITILMISRFDYQKNTEEGINIFLNAKIKTPSKIRLVILGDGDDRASLMQKYAGEQSIEMPGNTSDVSGWLDRSHIYLNSSRWEGLSLGILEAMATGMPVIASAVVGNIDCIESGKNGELYKQGDTEEAGNILSKILKDFDSYQKLARSSRETAEEKYNVKLMTQKTRSLYEDAERN